MPKFTITSSMSLPRGQLRSWCYNGVDCLATREIADTLLPRMGAAQDRYYRFTLAQQLPAFDMTLRGILVDTAARDKRVKILKQRLRSIQTELNKLPLIKEKWDLYVKVTGACPKSKRKDGKHTWERGVPDSPERTCTECKTSRFTIAPFNPQSSDQCGHLFNDILGLPKKKNVKGEYSMDEEIIESIGRDQPDLKTVTDLIIEARKTKKQIGFLNARLSPDERYHATFSVGTPWTGRWSSHKFNGMGGNAQNIDEQNRHIFIPDPGYTLAYIDLKQAESNIVAHLAGCEKYIEAHAIGDVHTYVTRLVWPELPWTGDIFADKKIAKSQQPEWDPAPGHDLRFQAKRVQHGGNYGMTPFGIAVRAHIPVKAAEASQNRYFKAFAIRPWQRSVAKRVFNREALEFPLGFEIRLVGRPWDKSTIRQGLSAVPQGTVGHLVGIGACLIWQRFPAIQLLAQVHDALFVQFPSDDLDLLKEAARTMQLPLRVVDIKGTERITTIEAEAAIGQNWGHASKDNPDGLEEIEI